MALRVKEKFVRNNFIEEEQKRLNKEVELETDQPKMGDFLIRLDKECKPVKDDLERILKKAELNARYLELTVSIQKIKSQQVYENYTIY